MAEKCICCGKKVGLLNGSHLNNQVCDNCYFPIGSYLTAIEESNDSLIIENNYSELCDKVQASPYSTIGKDYLIKIADTIIKNKREIINIKAKREQIKKSFKVTTSNKFDGYNITEYYGIVSGSIILVIGALSGLNEDGKDFFGTGVYEFSEKLEQARNSSINKMCDEAINQGGNALIGVSFDYINFGSNMIGVVANGTVVEIVKQCEKVNGD